MINKTDRFELESSGPVTIKVSTGFACTGTYRVEANLVDKLTSVPVFEGVIQTQPTQQKEVHLDLDSIGRRVILVESKLFPQHGKKSVSLQIEILRGDKRIGLVENTKDVDVMEIFSNSIIIDKATKKEAP